MDFNRIDEVLNTAEEEYLLNVVEPPKRAHVNKDGILHSKRGESFKVLDEGQTAPHSSQRILEYIKTVGWNLDFYTNSGSLKAGGFQWCGAFMAYCFKSVGLKKEIRVKTCPSTYRLYRDFQGTPRSIDLNDIQAGDVVVVGKKGSRAWGSHITIVTEVEETHVQTIEGNAHGISGGGQWMEGVIKRKRPFKKHAKKGESYVQFAYRFLDEDFEDA